MARKPIDVDVHEAIKMLSELQGKDFQKVYRSALRAGANILKKETDQAYAAQTNLPKRKVKEAKVKSRTVKPGQAKITMHKEEGYMNVHIMKDYMMRWFELGTRPRIVKKATTTLMKNRKGKSFVLKHKPRNRRAGSIQPLRLFQAARNRNEKRIQQAIANRIVKAIKRLNNKKK